MNTKIIHIICTLYEYIQSPCDSLKDDKHVHTHTETGRMHLSHDCHKGRACLKTLCFSTIIQLHIWKVLTAYIKRFNNFIFIRKKQIVQQQFDTRKVQRDYFIKEYRSLILFTKTF